MCLSIYSTHVNPVYSGSAPGHFENTDTVEYQTLEYEANFGPLEDELDDESFNSSVLDGSQVFLTRIDEEPGDDDEKEEA